MSSKKIKYAGFIRVKTGCNRTVLSEDKQVVFADLHDRGRIPVAGRLPIGHTVASEGVPQRCVVRTLWHVLFCRALDNISVTGTGSFKSKGVRY